MDQVDQQKAALNETDKFVQFYFKYKFVFSSWGACTSSFYIYGLS